MLRAHPPHLVQAYLDCVDGGVVGHDRTGLLLLGWSGCLGQVPGVGVGLTWSRQ